MHEALSPEHRLGSHATNRRFSGRETHTRKHTGTTLVQYLTLLHSHHAPRASQASVPALHSDIRALCSYFSLLENFEGPVCGWQKGENDYGKTHTEHERVTSLAIEHERTILDTRDARCMRHGTHKRTRICLFLAFKVHKGD